MCVQLRLSALTERSSRQADEQPVQSPRPAVDIRPELAIRQLARFNQIEISSQQRRPAAGSDLRPDHVRDARRQGGRSGCAHRLPSASSSRDRRPLGNHLLRLSGSAH